MQKITQMNKNMQQISKSFLQSGNDLPITKTLHFKHPTIQEIIDIDKDHNGLYSEEVYYAMINIFLTDPYTYMVYLDDKGLDFECVKPFDLFILLYNDYLDKLKSMESMISKEQLQELNRNNIYLRSINFFFGIDDFFIAKDETGETVLGYGDNELLIDSNIYNYIFEFIKKINGIQESEHINPEDEWAKQILIDDEREKLKKLAKKQENNNEESNRDKLGNLLSSITWSCNGGVTPFNRNQLHMYDVVDGIQRTDKLLNYKNTMVGLYSGCVEKKHINFDDLHWSN